MPSVLFLCTHNSARSQIAEATLRHLDTLGMYEAYSAGTDQKWSFATTECTLNVRNKLGVDWT